MPHTASAGDDRAEFARAIRAALDTAAREGARRPTQAQIAAATALGQKRPTASRSAISAWQKGDRLPASWAALSSFLTALERTAALPRGRFDEDHWKQLYAKAKADSSPTPTSRMVALRVSEADPLELMVHRARTDDEGSAVPAYIPRDIDPPVREALRRAGERGGVVLLVGDSTAGKTRCAYEAMVAVLPDHLLILPRDVTELSEAVAMAVRASGKDEHCVLWLNDMERYLGPGSLALHDIRALRKAGTVILGTMRSRIRKDLPDDELLRLAEEFEVSRLWSPAELERAQAELRSGGDQRLRLALGQAADFGIAETLATGPQLWQELSHASVVGGNPRGAALVRAAIDLALAGLNEALPVDLITELHEDYLPGRNKQLIGPEPLEAALAWATNPREAVTRLLIPEDDGLRAFEYLLDAHLREKRPGPGLLPERVWEAALSTCSERHQHFSVAVAAHANTRLDVILRALTPLAEASDVEAMRALGLLTEGHDRKLAAQWLRRAIEAGDVLSLRLMGNHHFRGQDRIAANNWYRRAAEAGDEISQSYFNEPRPLPSPAPHPSAPPAPDLAAPEAEEDEYENYEDEGEDAYGPTPRTLRLLEEAFKTLADEAYDAIEIIGDARVDLGPNHVSVFSDLPVLTWGASTQWRRLMARCFDDLADDLTTDKWIWPTCTGEEMAVHLALTEASYMAKNEPELVAELVKGVPAEPNDYDWGLCMTVFLEDTDVLFLYEPWSQGIEDPDHSIGQFLGVANLGAEDWFQPFREEQTRDPERGFRR
ncbi:tetratricopeptide repeat protein [Streptomyces bacillaris]|uniref:tetratricopeptide repeat protein n=1 Tax=Streptomyces bacillaris TaxID=68179 RepID=UPI0037029D01